MNFFRVKIAVLGKKSFKHVANDLHVRLNLLQQTHNKRQWYLMAIDVAKSMLY